MAKPALYIARQAGIDVPENIRFIMVLGEKPGPEDRFSGESVIESATYNPRGSEKYIRIQCVDEKGKMAFSNPVFWKP